MQEKEIQHFFLSLQIYFQLCPLAGHFSCLSAQAPFDKRLSQGYDCPAVGETPNGISPVRASRRSHCLYGGFIVFGRLHYTGAMPPFVSHVKVGADGSKNLLGTGRWGIPPPRGGAALLHSAGVLRRLVLRALLRVAACIFRVDFCRRVLNNDANAPCGGLMLGRLP